MLDCADVESRSSDAAADVSRLTFGTETNHRPPRTVLILKMSRLKRMVLGEKRSSPKYPDESRESGARSAHRGAPLLRQQRNQSPKSPCQPLKNSRSPHRGLQHQQLCAQSLGCFTVTRSLRRFLFGKFAKPSTTVPLRVPISPSSLALKCTLVSNNSRSWLRLCGILGKATWSTSVILTGRKSEPYQALTNCGERFWSRSNGHHLLIARMRTAKAQTIR